MSHKIIASIVLYNIMHGALDLYDIFHTDTVPSAKWLILTVAQSAQFCPCSDCGGTTRCYDMNHTIVPVGLPTRGVERLYLHNNMITKIYGRDFREMNDLQFLTLDSNNITEVDRNAFAGLDALKTLHLEHNQLRYLADGTFTGLTKLKNLFLNDNQLNKYPGDLPYLESIEKLNVDNNIMKRIHWTSFINQKSLKVLNLWKNPMPCDCNAKQLIKWLTGTSRGRVISIGPPPEACVKNESKATQCAKVEINKIVHLNSESNVYVINDDATMHCDVTSDLMPYWMMPRGGRVLPYSRGRIEAYINGTLKISNLLEADNGTYRCIAQYVSSSNRKSKAVVIAVTTASTPTVVRTRQDVEVIEGEIAQFKCEVTGVPKPTITWLGPSQAKPIDQSNFTEGGNLRLSDDNTTLTIRDTTKENQGVWRCRASNREGTTVGERRLQVMVASDNTTVIAIAVVAGTLVIIVAIATAIVCRRMRRGRQENKETKTEYSNEVVEKEEEREEQENVSLKPEVEESKKTNNHQPTASISSKLSEKISKTEKQEKTLEQQANACTDKDLRSCENFDFVLNFVPGSDQLQQPYEHEPVVKGFRL